MRHEERFPPRRLNGRCRFGQATYAEFAPTGETRRKRSLHLARMILTCDPLVFSPEDSVSVDTVYGAGLGIRLLWESAALGDGEGVPSTLTPGR